MNSKLNFALFAVVTSVLLSSCSSETSQQDAAAAGQVQAVETDFVILQTSNAGTQSQYPGSIEGSVNVDIKPQVSGYLEKVFVKEGDYVKKGQLLFKIKPEVYAEQVNSSNAALRAALANQATAKLEVDKIAPLVSGKVVSEIQLKSVQAAYEAATAQVEQARATLGSSRINQDFTTIKAPVSGYIGRIPSRLGSLVGPSDAMPLTSLSDINTVYVYFSMSEAEFLGLKRSQDKAAVNELVELVLADGSTYNQKGKLETASGNIDRTTGSIPMKAVFSNPERLLRSGGACRVIIRQAVNGIIKLPKIAAKDIQDKLFVYKLGDSTNVEMVPVEISGGSSDSYFIKSGVKAGDTIAVNRIDLLQMGVGVIPKIVSIDSLQ